MFWTLPRAAGLVLPLAAAIVAGSQRAGRLSDADVREVRELVAAADRAAKGELQNESRFRFEPHFLRSEDGRTYVPFSLVFEDQPADRFHSLALYIRVARRGDRTTSADRNRPLGPTGVAVPVFAFDAAAAASAALRLLDRPDRPRPDAYPFEAVHFTPAARRGATAFVRRAFVVPPGAYDVYLVVRQREEARWSEGAPQSAALRLPLDVPDFSTKGLTLSTPILAERVEPLARPLTPEQQAARPYALGTAEFLPAVTTAFARADTPAVAFLVYNAAPDREGKPDVEIEYAFFRLAREEQRLVGPRLSARFHGGSLPANFDLRAGHQIVPVQELPIASLLAGEYRLEITVLDRLSSQKAARSVQFAIAP